MRSKPLPTDGASPISNEGTHTPGLEQRAVDEVMKFSAIVLYLWVMFGTFALHESVVSAKDHINYHFYGFALVNALVLGKVTLIAEDLHPFFAFREIGRVLGKRRLHSLIFTNRAAAAFQSPMSHGNR
jgi:hypothetical protein